jgi:hypothetical protein
LNDGGILLGVQSRPETREQLREIFPGDDD